MNLLRLVISESRRFEALGDIFLNSGPKHAEACLAKYIRDSQIGATTCREIVPEKLASQFIDMITRRFQLRLLIGHATQILEDEKIRVVQDAVALYQSY
ncbi:TetR/AcrR family transcriptional regulator C-terminal domain-containing protein [Vibrio sp. PP-XX7]